MIHVNTYQADGESMFLGMADPWIWGGYLVAFSLVGFCVIYGWLKGKEDDVE